MHSFLFGDESFDDSQTTDIFSLENVEVMDYQKSKSSFMQENFNSLTLVRHEFDQNITSNDNTKISS